MPRIPIVAEGGGRQGHGHWVRSKALADALHAQGATPHLLTLAFQAPPAWIETDLPYPMSIHRTWGSLRPELVGADLIVVDAPSLHARVVTTVRARVPLCVIDDGPPRYLTADILVNGQPSAKPYPGKAEQLIGPQYALLREEIASANKVVIRDTVDRVLVYWGGNPPRADVGRILESCWFDGDIQYVEAGEFRTAGWIAQLQAADLAILPASMSCLEACCLGLPTLTYATAGHQAAIQEALADADAAYPLSRESFAHVLTNAAERKALSTVGQTLIAGHGATHVATHLLRSR